MEKSIGNKSKANADQYEWVRFEPRDIIEVYTDYPGVLERPPIEWQVGRIEYSFYGTRCELTVLTGDDQDKVLWMDHRTLVDFTHTIRRQIIVNPREHLKRHPESAPFIYFYEADADGTFREVDADGNKKTDNKSTGRPTSP